MAQVKFGVHYSRLHEIMPIPQFARRVEEWGFDSVWVPEGLVNEAPALDIMMALSGLVHHTTRVTVGTSVVLLPLRNPAILAKEVATLDHLSGGRVVLGIGVGGPPESHPAAFEACGVNIKERGARSDEALEVMKKLWTGRPVSHEGRFYRFEDIQMLPPPVQRPHPPIWAGGVAEGMLRRAARCCNGFVPLSVPPQKYQRMWERIEKYCEAEGNDASKITKALHMFCHMSQSREEARKLAEANLARRRGFHFDLVDDGRYAFGSTDECAKRIEAFVEIGITHIILNNLGPLEEIPSQWDRFAGEVLPRFK